MNAIYLDNAATTPIAPNVAARMNDILCSDFGNPSSIYATGRKAKGIIEESRVKIAKLLNANTSEIYFTSGGTESDNFALINPIECLGITHLITSPIEHHAVLNTANYLANKHAIKLSLLSVDRLGKINLNDLEDLLKTNPQTLVSLMHGNNELGNLNDLNAIANLCKKYDAVFHTDAVQTIGYFNFDLENAHISLLSASAHKFNGPKGVGFLYINKKVKTKALIHGGGQERNMRAGTENVAGIAGMALALENCYNNLAEKSSHIKNIKSYFVEQVKKELPEVTFNGDLANSHYTVANISIPSKLNTDLLLFNLDLKGIAASGGSACSSGAHAGSHVLQAIKADESKANIRFSFGIYNTIEEIDKTILTLKSILIT